MGLGVGVGVGKRALLLLERATLHEVKGKRLVLRAVAGARRDPLAQRPRRRRRAAVFVLELRSGARTDGSGARCHQADQT